MKKQQANNIGVEVPAPAKMCTDLHCPFHSALSVRGRIFTGKVVKEPFHRTTTVEFPRQFYIPKFERYEKRRSRIKAHVPDCLEVKKDSAVRIMETRKISKTKNFVVIEVKL